MYNVNTEQYSGPLEKLLELIEERKLEVTQVNLALVTDDFLKHLEGLKSEGRQKTYQEVRLLADFLVVASRLLLIKSKALLPTLELSQEEEEDIKDLEMRLAFYQQFKPAINSVKEMYADKNKMASRPLLLGRKAIFYPPKNLTPILLSNSLTALFENLKKISLEFQTIETTLIKLEEKIEEIIQKVSSGISNFGNLIKEKSKKEIIVMFLALLHLLREQAIEAEQTEGFSEIIIKKNGNSS